MLTSKKLPVLYSITAFIGASLIFAIQPLITKILLPHFGGSATLWATATLFFQVTLLTSYLLVHITSRFTKTQQITTLIVLALSSLLTLPIHYSEHFSSSMSPVFRAFLTLATIIGLPFALLATTGPLTQRWYSLTNGYRNEDPYFIYAASNAGSLIGLLSYPLLIEPNLHLQTQITLWTVMFGTFLILLATCYNTVRKTTKQLPVSKLSSKTIPTKRKLKWVFLAFVPSSLMLGVTTRITADFGSFPLLWVIPLSLYLLTMIIAFGRTSNTVNLKTMLFSIGLAYILTLYVLTVGYQTSDIVKSFIVNSLVLIGVFVLVSIVFHTLLATDRPKAEDLTGFYVLVSLGGALGGFLNGFIAPILLDRTIELELAIAITPLLFIFLLKPKSLNFRIMQLSGAAITIILLPVASVLTSTDNVLVRARTFYGEYEVIDDTDEILLFSGTTLHGTQYKNDRSIPTTYYSKKGPVGSIMEARHSRNVAVIGLGTGTIAAYGQPGDSYTFIEIDEKMKKLAEDSRYFTYLKDSKAEVEIKIGDGRLEIDKVPDRSLDLLVLDAFSSDSIPTHLLTTEAFKIYESKISTNGIIAIHVSNRYYDLVPVVKSAAKNLEAPLLYSSGSKDADARSSWTVITKDKKLRETLMKDSWIEIDTTPVEWTDDYAPLLKVFMGF